MEKLLDRIIPPKYRLIIFKVGVDEIDRVMPKARKILAEFDEELQGDGFRFRPSELDMAIALLLSREMRMDCTPFEEMEGLPEFSIYYNWDARSFCGRWGYSGDHQTIDESGLFFALVDDREAQEEIAQLIDEHLQECQNPETIIAYVILDTEHDP